MITSTLIALAVIGAIAGFTSMGLRRNFADGYPSTLMDWLLGLVTAGATVFSVLLIGSDVAWYGAIPGALLALVGIRPLVRVATAPRRTTLMGSIRPSWVWAAAAGLVILGSVLGMGLWAGFIAASVLMVLSAGTEVIWGDEQARRMRDVAAPLAAVLGVAEERIWDSAPMVDTDGTIVVRHPHATTIARLDRIESLVTQAMPGYEVTQASSARIVLAPVGIDTIQRRNSLAESGGLIAGTDDAIPHPSTGIALEEW